MKITPDQVRETAQILFPETLATDPATALVEALKYLHAASLEPPPVRGRIPSPSLSKKNNHEPPQEVADLEEHLKTRQIHVTAAAKAIGVHAMSLYSWFHGNSVPKAESLAKIRTFLAKT